MKLTIVLAAATMLFASPVLAQEAGTEAQQQDAFVAIDADADGSLSLEEVQKVEPKVTEADFARYDADDDEVLSKMEFANWTADARATAEASAGE